MTLKELVFKYLGIQNSSGEEKEAIYNDVAFDWNSLDYVEKRILAFWHVCSPVEALEVFTQAELDSFRYYKIYKHCADPIRIDLTPSKRS